MVRDRSKQCRDRERISSEYMDYRVGIMAKLETRNSRKQRRQANQVSGEEREY
jgi:hypothetical protein